MEARQRQPGMLEGLSRFLVQHERCGAGFDVAHPAGLGSGRVSITCRGCGARHEYATATIEIERELRIEPAPRREPQEAPPRQLPEPEQEPRPAIPPRPAPYPDTARGQRESAAADSETAAPKPQRKSAEEILRAHAAKAEGAGRQRMRGPEFATRRPRTPSGGLGGFWRSPAVALGAVVLVAVALGLGVVWLVNEVGDTDESIPQSASTTPAPPGVLPDPDAPAGVPAPSPVPGAPQPAITTLRTDRFTIEVPRRWDQEAVDGGLLLEPPGGGRASVRIFFEFSPGLTEERMAAQTRAFLSRRVPGARLLPNRTEIAGQSSYELTARGPGETAIAVNVLRGPYRYLLLRRIFAGAKPRTSEAASRIVRSFEPG